MLLFTAFPNILNFIASIFGIQRGADALVYISIVFLFYFVILLLNKIEENREDMTSVVREIALQNSPKKEISWEIAFLIRVYNEEKKIKETLDALFSAGYNNIVIVNDGSQDNSWKILESYWDKIVLLKHFKNRGGWAALETGFEYFRRYGKCELVCTFDADGQHQIKDLEKFLQEFQTDQDLEVILGSRFIKKTNTNVWLMRKIVLKLGIIFTFFVSHLKLTDSHNGYRVFRLQTLEKIKLSIDDMSYASEMIDIIASKKIKFKEVPVDIIYTDYSLSKWQKSSNAIKIALKTLWYKFFK